MKNQRLPKNWACLSLILAILLTFISMHDTLARVGESREQCRERYREYLGSYDGNSYYASGDMLVVIRFHNNIAYWARYGRMSPSELSFIRSTIHSLNADESRTRRTTTREEEIWSYLTTKRNEGILMELKTPISKSTVWRILNMYASDWKDSSTHQGYTRPRLPHESNRLDAPPVAISWTSSNTGLTASGIIRHEVVNTIEFFTIRDPQLQEAAAAYRRAKEDAERLRKDAERLRPIPGL